MANHQKKFYSVTGTTELRVPPQDFEFRAAQRLAEFFKADVTFISPTNHKTPDFLINGVRWELKSPIGDGKRTVQHQFYRALKQSRNIIFDASRSKMSSVKLRGLVQYQFNHIKTVKRLIFIDKAGRVTELKRETKK